MKENINIQSGNEYTDTLPLRMLISDNFQNYNSEDKPQWGSVFKIPNLVGTNTLTMEQVVPQIHPSGSGEFIGSQNYYQTIITSEGLVDEKLVTQKKYECPIDLFGDTFVLGRDDEGVYIYHKDWTLSGEGKDLKEAVRDLLDTIIELREHYLSASIEDLDLSARSFREYLFTRLLA